MTQGIQGLLLTANGLQLNTQWTHKGTTPDGLPPLWDLFSCWFRSNPVRLTQQNDSCIKCNITVNAFGNSAVLHDILASKNGGSMITSWVEQPNIVVIKPPVGFYFFPGFSWWMWMKIQTNEQMCNTSYKKKEKECINGKING